MTNFCPECVFYKTENKKHLCKEKDKMTIEEYEDYFVDNVKKCPYFKEDDND